MRSESVRGVLWLMTQHDELTDQFTTHGGVKVSARLRCASALAALAVGCAPSAAKPDSVSAAACDGCDAHDAGAAADAGDAGAADTAVVCANGMDCPPSDGCDDGGCGAPPDPNAWPNAESRANSDPWIAQNHDAITSMHPRVLAINFVNLPRVRARFTANVQAVAAALTEGSQYHGYSNSAAKPFVSFETVKLVDLADATPPPGWNHLNSSKYPLKCAANAPYQFDYSALFGDTFAGYYAISAPDNPSKSLGLCELLDKGMVHEVWLHVDGDPDAYTCPNGVEMSDFQLMEVLEAKPRYDAQGNKTGDWDACAGNGCFSQDDFTVAKACGRSVRVLYINGTRGAGCAVHSLGHGIESTARDGTIPYLKQNFLHFANFDLRSRLGLPIDDWYSCSDASCITYTGPDALSWRVGARAGSIAAYAQGCGSVHFPPNARGHYDDSNPFGVLSTCENYGIGDADGGKGAQEMYTDAKSQMYDALAPDCEGGWQVYWRQSFPGHASPAKGVDGKPMKNWWPFLFY